MEFIKKYLNLKKLNRREKYIIYGAGGILGLLIIVQFVITPFVENKNQMQRSLQTKKSELAEMRRLQAEHQILKAKLQLSQTSIGKREKGFTLFSFLEKAAGEAVLKGHIKYMKPSSSQSTGPYKESMVEMKLEGITLNQLVGYLYRIESLENIISIKRISIQENKKESGYLDTILQVLTFQ